MPAILSRLIADSCRRRGIRVHFPLLVAGGYAGAIVSMQGLSGSIPLVLNTPDHFLADRIGLIGLDQTIFSGWSMSIVLAILIVVPITISRLARRTTKSWNSRSVVPRRRPYRRTRTCGCHLRHPWTTADG